MNRQEFMKRLEELLCKIPACEREDALSYYNDYFDEAGIENEAQVIMELGSPELVAEKILVGMQNDQNAGGTCTNSESEKQNYEEKSKQKNAKAKLHKMKKSSKILIIVLLILTFPLWIGVVAGLFGTAVGLIGAIVGILIAACIGALGLLLGGIICVFAGITRIIFAPILAFASVGIGAILIAIALLFVWFSISCVGVWIPKLVKAIVKGVKKLFRGDKGGNEI